MPPVKAGRPIELRMKIPNSVVIIQTGMPWNIGDSTDDFAGRGEQTGNSAANQSSQWNFFGKPSEFTPTHGFVDVTVPTGSYNVCNATVMSNCVYGVPGIPYFPGTTDLSIAPTGNTTCNQHASNMGPLAVASLIPPPYGGYGTTQWNPFPDGGFPNWDLSVTKVFKFSDRWSAQFRAEAFNVLNHPNFANPYSLANISDPSQVQSPGLGVSTSTPDVANFNPVLGSGGARDIQLGLKLIF